MISSLLKRYVYPIATMSGGIIGVGFLSLPYITTQVGLLPMLVYFVILVAVVVFLHLMFAEVSLHTPDFKRWPGFVEYYFGSLAKKALLVPTIVGYFTVLLAYLIVGSQFLFALCSPWLGGPRILYSLVFAGLLAIIAYIGVQLVSRIDLVVLLLLFISLFFIGSKGSADIHMTHFSLGAFNWKTALLPYGAILFSLWGTGLIPETEEMLKKDKKRFKKVVVIGTLVPAIFYVLFVFIVVGISGNQTTESALVGLNVVLDGWVTLVVLAIGVMTTLVASMSSGLLLKKIFVYDLKMGELVSWTLVCFVPVILLFSGFNTFIPLISFVGGVLLGIDGLLICLMYKKVGGKNPMAYLLIALFVFGIFYSLFLF